MTGSEFPCLELIENLAGSSELCWKIFNAHETVSLKLQGSEFFLVLIRQFLRQLPV